MVPHRQSLTLSAETLHRGTTIRYHYRTGSALATVVERTPERVTFVGEDCDGTFTDDQIDRLFATDRLQVVLDDELHLPADATFEE
ncbi:hypothetical protein [Natronococcus occultus]|uniref:Uncharacterized protein n=1 Tax=Natronococcus occultus SP4 TaxID=694430 RepID=L0JW57_9EURY|nr:hypothetical protein [Natronococcus occultus]AGB36103.1 hypothetical protein Natoc_0226 [Natronococcus occultus SP4]